MIIKGWTQTGPEALGPYLTNEEKNERISVVEIRGTVSQDLTGALQEMDAYSEGTRCEKPLYHAVISPEPPNRLSPEQRLEAVKALEKEIGLENHARAIVLHEKKGREHIHIVWTRIDLENMRAVHLSNNYRKHEQVARDLERRFGHDRVQGAHAEREGVPRPDRSPTRAELRQEERTGIKGKDVKGEVTEIYRASDGAEAFKAALEDRGYILAKGDKRDFVIVDRGGGEHNLARRIEGMRTAELREFMQSIEREKLPSVAMARDAQLSRVEGRMPEIDPQKWEDALAKDAISKAKRVDEIEKREIERRITRSKAKLTKSYSNSQDYVSQTTSARKHHNRRQNRTSNQRPQSSQAEPTHSMYERIKSGHPHKQVESHNKPRSAYERMKEKLSGVEITDGKGRLLDRLSEMSAGFVDEGDPDRQPKAPGGGRTRSR